MPRSCCPDWTAADPDQRDRPRQALDHARHGLRLSRALGLSERYWINMQTDYDIETEHDLHEEELRQVEVLVSPEAA
jgi:hypothetical protein